MPQTNYKWDPRALNYRGRDGKFVKRAVLIAAIQKAVEETEARVRDVSERLQSGKINLAQWTIEMTALIKANHVLTAGIAQGGKAQLSPSALGKIGAQTKAQYQYLRKFSRQIANGLPLDKRFVERASMYARAARETFSETERRFKRDAGYDEEKNILNAFESCTGCITQSTKGWVPAGTLKPLGERTCLVNCKCDIILRKAA